MNKTHKLFFFCLSNGLSIKNTADSKLRYEIHASLLDRSDPLPVAPLQQLLDKCGLHDSKGRRQRSGYTLILTSCAYSTDSSWLSLHHVSSTKVCNKSAWEAHRQLPWNASCQSLRGVVHLHSSKMAIETISTLEQQTIWMPAPDESALEVLAYISEKILSMCIWIIYAFIPVWILELNY